MSDYEIQRQYDQWKTWNPDTAETADEAGFMQFKAGWRAAVAAGVGVKREEPQQVAIVTNSEPVGLRGKIAAWLASSAKRAA